MKCTLHPGKLSGTVTPPSSKSHSIRAILFAALAEGESTLHNLLESPDTAAAFTAAKQFGAQISGNRILGTAGKPKTPSTAIDAGNSGLVYRFGTAIAGLCSGTTAITGDASIQNSRPIQPLLQAMQSLGMKTQNSKPPIQIQGPWKGGSATLSTEDSQPLSALLSVAPFGQSETTLLVPHVGEKPWIELTFDWLSRLGVEYDRQGYEIFRIPGNQRVPAFTYSAPADFSSAAFPIAAALITKSRVTIEGLDMHDIQGDKKLLTCLEQMGARWNLTGDRLSIEPSELHGIQVDINDFIDALPILAVVATQAKSPTQITNAAIARHKESDRIACIAMELKKMGANIEERPDGLLIHPSPLNGAPVEGHHDHRIAMSLAIAGLVANGETTIEGVSCVAKTYPNFFRDLERLGATLKVTQ